MKTDPKASHYESGGFNAIEVIRAKLTKDQFAGYLLGNVMKYSMRANFKSDFARDIEKIKYFAEWLYDAVDIEDSEDAIMIRTYGITLKEAHSRLICVNCKSPVPQPIRVSTHYAEHGLCNECYKTVTADAFDEFLDDFLFEDDSYEDYEGF